MCRLVNFLLRVIVLAGVLFQSGCISNNFNQTATATSNEMSEDLYHLPKDCDFSKVSNASNQEYECSPKLKNKFFSSFEGILINAPTKVVWPKNADPADYPVGPMGDTSGPLRLMLAGLCRVPFATLGLGGDTSKSVVLVAVDRETGTTYSGKMPRPDVHLMPNPFAGKKVEPDEQTLKSLRNSYFNFDLVHDLGLPIKKASYSVYATLGTYKSNSLIIYTALER